MAESAVHSGPQLVERYALINGISPNGKMWCVDRNNEQLVGKKFPKLFFDVFRYLMMIEDGRTVKVDRKLLPQDTPLGSTVHLKIWFVTLFYDFSKFRSKSSAIGINKSFSCWR